MNTLKEQETCKAVNNEVTEKSDDNIDDKIVDPLNAKKKTDLVFSSSPQSPNASTSIPLLLFFLWRYNHNRQKHLTAPPLIFRQKTPQNDDICARMGLTLERAIRPSSIATSGIANSMAAYARRGPAPKKRLRELRIKLQSRFHHNHIGHHYDDLHFREIMTMGADGAKVAIDWELPEKLSIPYMASSDIKTIKQSILQGPIAKPVILILHGINNDASFGYIRKCMRICTDRGWIAAGMNFRGCGGTPLNTPRGYTGAYTGDLRSVVNQISARLEMAVTSSSPVSSDPDNIFSFPAPLFIVGNSLGANLVVKYLGEEGLAAQEYIEVNGRVQRAHPTALPRCLAGAISLGNPLVINSENIAFPWGHILGLGLKKTFLKNYVHLKKFQCNYFQEAFSKALWRTGTVGALDCAMSPFLIRNESTPPFATRIGYQCTYEKNNSTQNPKVSDAEAKKQESQKMGRAYWRDASSYKWLDSVSVPLLKITAQDDFLVAHHAVAKINHCVQNPNLIVVKTKSGGHLGWFHVDENNGPGSNNSFLGNSWADQATADFIAAVIAKRRDEKLWCSSTVEATKTSANDQNFAQHNRNNEVHLKAIEKQREKVASETRQKLFRQPLVAKL